MKDRQHTIYIVVPPDGKIQHVVNRIEKLDFEIIWERVCTEDCLSKLRDTLPDVIIAEDNSSIENFLWEVRSKYENLPIIVLSGTNDYSNGLRMVEEGAEDYISRGQIERLDIAITRVLKKDSSFSKAGIRSGLYILEEEIVGMCFDEQYTLENILQHFVESIERIHPDLIPVVVRIEDMRMYSWISSGQLSNRFLSLLDGTRVGPNAGSAGVAAYHKKNVVCLHISEDERCKEVRENALAEGLMASWAIPILVEGGKIYASFCCYCRQESHSLSLWNQEALDRIQKILQIVIGFKQVHQSLKLREQRFRALVQDGADLISIVDKSGRFKYVAPFSNSSEGINAEDFIGKSAFDYVHPKDRQRLKRILEGLAPGERVEVGPFRSLDADELPGWKETTITNMMNNPAVEGYVVNSRDITDQMEREQKLRESVERYEIVSKATSDTIWDLDLEEDVIRYNSNISEMFGYDTKRITKVGKWWRGKLHPDDRPYVLQKLDDAWTEKEDRFQMEYRFRCADGTYKYVYDRAFVVTDEDGQPVRMIGAMQDVTHQRTREQILKDSLKEKKILLMEIHHRVKNNLAVVSGMMQLQAFQSESEELRQKLFHSVGRIKTMASIHEFLYESQNFSNISFNENIKKLISAIIETVSLNQSVGVDYELEPVDININQAIPCSLIINEIFSNMLQYEYRGVGFLKIVVSLFEEDETIHIKISNNLLDDQASDILSDNTLSRELIETLSRQLEADYGYKIENDDRFFYLSFDRSEANGIGSTKVKDKRAVIKGDAVRTVVGY
ncbi:PAS domain-containing protein [Aliifodinibius salicampi]|uniref:histidine kinase n=1 Tax=Fodinibius salicampi TaxID=1920655 RepID=A0ABT3PYS4_9BACT|nr:response regulator [Fodinibius salicampi]MCW9713017.1 PAS domain-containing protein [Fodinibius salicampi]